MYDLPEPPTASAAGQANRDATIDERADEMLAALNAAIARRNQTPTAVRIEDPAIPSFEDGPRVGTAPAAPQPGRPAMSQRATDDSVRMICFGGMILLTGAGIGIVMVASDYGNPTVIGVFFGGLATIALAVARLLRRAGQAAPPVINQTYTGPVRQEINTDQRRSITQKNIRKH